MHTVKTLLKDRTAVWTIILLLVVEVFVLIYRFDLLSNYRLFYLLALPLLLPFICTDAQRFLFTYELISRSYHPVKYHFHAHIRRFIFIITYNVILTVSSFLNDLLSGLFFELSGYLLIWLILDLIGLFFCLFADILLLISHKISVSLVVLFVIIELDYLFAEIGTGNAFLFSLIYPVLHQAEGVDNKIFQINIVFLILVFLLLVTIVIYSIRKADYCDPLSEE